MDIGTLILFSACYGITMKMADLFDEHGLKSLFCSRMVFGMLWGALGLLLVLENSSLAAVFVAMNLAFILRNRLDYRNHQLAASLILVGFVVFRQSVDMNLFILSYSVFLAFGSVKDTWDDIRHGKGVLYWVSESMWYYPVVGIGALLLGYGNAVLVSLVSYTVGYNIVKLISKRFGYR